MNHNQKLGKEGEDIAAGYLERKGYKILNRNYRCGKVEIDIIASHQNEIVFIEVKTRIDDMAEYPEKAVGRSKQRNIRIAADYFMHETDQSCPARFDIIAIIMGEKFEIEHFEDAFYPFDTY